LPLGREALQKRASDPVEAGCLVAWEPRENRPAIGGKGGLRILRVVREIEPLSEEQVPFLGIFQPAPHASGRGRIGLCQSTAQRSTNPLACIPSVTTGVEMKIPQPEADGEQRLGFPRDSRQRRLGGYGHISAVADKSSEDHHHFGLFPWRDGLTRVGKNMARVLGSIARPGLRDASK